MSCQPLVINSERPSISLVAQLRGYANTGVTVFAGVEQDPQKSFLLCADRHIGFHQAVVHNTRWFVTTGIPDDLGGNACHGAVCRNIM